jgi:hypothetical protein
MCPARTWDAGRTSALAAGVMDGKTYGEIATEMGVSRCSVIGAAHRSGIYRGDFMAATPRPPRERAATPRRPRDQTPRARRRQPEPQPAPPPAPSPPAVDAPIGGVTLLAAGYGQCRYVVGDAAAEATLFCGGRVVAGCSWCAEHAQRVFTPTGYRLTRRQ